MRQYQNEITSIDDHTALLEQVMSLPCAVVLSSYSHPLYEDTLTSWARYAYATTATSGASRTEVVWVNRPPLGGLW